MDSDKPPPPILQYTAPEHDFVAPPASVAILLSLPMAVVAYHSVPPLAQPFVQLIPSRWFWEFRAFAMLTALISLFLFCDKRVKRWSLFMIGNLLINIPGLAACTLSILRYVVINMPSPG